MLVHRSVKYGSPSPMFFFQMERQLHISLHNAIPVLTPRRNMSSTKSRNSILHGGGIGFVTGWYISRFPGTFPEPDCKETKYSIYTHTYTKFNHIYIYTWNLFVLYFWASTLQNKALSNQNNGHLGSRYTYIYKFTSIQCTNPLKNLPDYRFPSCRQWHSQRTTLPTTVLFTHNAHHILFSWVENSSEEDCVLFWTGR